MPPVSRLTGLSSSLSPRVTRLWAPVTGSSLVQLTSLAGLASTKQVRLTQPKVETILRSKRGFPVFGSSLSSHLASFPLPSGIAYPMQLCVTRLVMLGLEEEGESRPELGEEARGESLPNMFWIENLESELSWLGGLCLFC